MRRPVSLLCLALAPAIAAGAALTPSQIQVASTLAQPGVQLASRVQIEDRADGSRVIAVWLTNESTGVVELRDAAVEFPWVAPAGDDFRLATGASSTGRWPPTQIVDPRKARTEPVSGMYLLAGTGRTYALAAFVSWQTFWSKLHYRGGRVIVTADGEGRRIRPGETVALERVRLSEGADWQDLLFGYAGAIARELHLTPKPARHFVGWSTWDYYGRDFPAAAVRGNVEAMAQLLPNANLVQIDGGWWRERGDYGSLRADLGSDAMRKFAAEFRARGLTAGVHLDGMRFSPESVVAREHPEYFLHDERGQWLRERRSINGQILHLFVDYSHPGACAYMRDSLRRLRREWGFDYFKIDFLRAGIAEDVRRDAFDSDPTRRIVPHDPGLTSVERFHRAMAAFREGMGGDAYFVGCSTPFGPTFGHVDALRTGPDISPRFAAYQTQCEANAANFYLNGAVVQVDADYLVVRARADQDATLVKDRNKDGGNLALNEAEMWADYVALLAAPKIASDNLMILRDERKELVRFAAAQPACSRFVPLDYWRHARTRADAFEVFLADVGGRVHLVVFNWAGDARTYALRGLPVGISLERTLLRGAAKISSDAAAVRIALDGHHAVVFRLPEGADFDQIRRTIVIE